MSDSGIVENPLIPVYILSVVGADFKHGGLVLIILAGFAGFVYHARQNDYMARPAFRVLCL